MRRKWLLMLLVTIVLLTISCGAEPSTVMRTQVVDWGESVLELKIEYPPIVTAGESFPVHITVRLLEHKANEYPYIVFVSAEIEGTLVYNSTTPMEELEKEGDSVKLTLWLNAYDPLFASIPPGEKDSFTLTVIVRGMAGEQDFETPFSVPLYIYSPQLILHMRIEAPELVVEGEEFLVKVTVGNVGESRAEEAGVEILGPVSVEGLNWVKLGTILPGENKTATFRLRVEQRGNVTLRVLAWGLNSAGYNVSIEDSRVVAVKGRTSIELHADVSDGSVTLWGRVKPKRAYSGVRIEELKDGEWYKVIEMSTDEEGSFTITIEGVSAGTHVYRAVWPGDENYAGSVSPEVSVEIEKIPVTVNLALGKTSVKEGDLLPLKGSILPPVSGPVQILMDCGKGWVKVAEVTATGGTFEASVPVDAKAGTACRIKAVWPGDQNTLRAESNAAEIRVVEAGIRIGLEAVLVLAAIVAVVVAIAWFIKTKRASL